MPRQPRLDSPGLLHHVIFRGIEKCLIVKDDTDRLDFVARLNRLAVECSIEVYAWALMDNHVHLLVRSNNYGLSRFMRRLLTGHAIRFNLRYQRHGHLFQNRYKSFVCDDESYFLELVRYIHLNPVRANIVDDIEALNSYPWCGHAALVKGDKKSWQACDEVLLYFSKKRKIAIKKYQQFMVDGLDQGQRPELVGGGLRRSQHEAPGDKNQPELYDSRILGNGEFVEQVLRHHEEDLALTPPQEKQRLADEYIEYICTRDSITAEELCSGSRRYIISNARKEIALKLVRSYGLTATDVARRLDISTSAICKILERNH
ncbi:MAG: transposase [Deltaproteobacteria bacterium]|nr:transposase [Deltaproteobacteria bacterium]